ncbi:MAG TPA: Fic family protein, partial [Bacteroidales bacterium]|nr:Fic family protein [Bacteroidales bacterium]
MSNNNILQPLPPKREVETKAILKKLVSAHRYLAELKGISKTIPNESILLYTLPLLEAKDSSAVENIITTHDEIYKDNLFENFISNPASKEVQRYAQATREGFKQLKNKNFIISNELILKIQEIIVSNNAGYRKLPGTELKNFDTGETVYTPPQDYEQIVSLMKNLIDYINDDQLHPIDP